MNRDILGSEGNLAQYSIPVEKKKGVSMVSKGTITMENYRVQKIRDKLDFLIDKSINEGSQERMNKWKNCVTHYREMMHIMRKRANITQRRNLSPTSTMQIDFSRCWLICMDPQGSQIIST